MNEPQKRKLLQIHLSTLLALMFVAGGMLWINVRARQGGKLITLDGNEARLIVSWELRGRNGEFPDAYSLRGWPYGFYEWYESPFFDDFTNRTTLKPVIYWKLLLADVAFALIVLSFVALIFEYAIRRRERKE